MTHICIGKLTIIGLDNGLLPKWHQAIIWTSAGILLIGPSGTNFCEILIGVQIFSFKKMYWKMSDARWHPFCLCLNVLTPCGLVIWHHKSGSILSWAMVYCQFSIKPLPEAMSTFYQLCKISIKIAKFSWNPDWGNVLCIMIWWPISKSVANIR